MKYPDRICPACGGDIELDDIYDVSDHDDYCIGTCLACGKQYQWIEQYQYVGTTDMKENI